MASGPLAAPDTKKRLDGMVTVRLEAEKDKAKAARFQPAGLPTLVYLSPRGVILDRTEKYVSEDELAKRLDALAEKSRTADEELERLEKKTKDAPEDLDALEGLAAFYEKHQNWAEAVPLLEKLVKQAGEKEFPVEKRHQRWLELVRGKAVLLDFDGAVKTAEALAKHAGQVHKTDPLQMAEILIGFCREQQGKREEALKAYERAVSVAPDSKLGKKAAASRDRLKAEK